MRKTRQWLKKHFIPYEGNQHRPHLLHSHNIRDLIGVIFFFELILFVLPTLNFTRMAETLNLGSVLPGTLSLLTNEERIKNDLPILNESEVLNKAAQLKAEDMAKKSYFAHTSPEGLTPWHWFNKVNYHYIYAGENLAINFTDSMAVTSAWMNSPLHRANIVGNKYREVGTGVAAGVYQGREAIFVAQLYAAPLSELGNFGQGNAVTTGLPAELEGAGAVSPVSTSTINYDEYVLGEMSGIEQGKADFWQRLLLMPEQTVAAVLFVMLLIVLIALFLNIFIKFDHQHSDLIDHALIVVIVIFGLQIANSYAAKHNLATSFAYTDIPSEEVEYNAE